MPVQVRADTQSIDSWTHVEDAHLHSAGRHRIRFLNITQINQSISSDDLCNNLILNLLFKQKETSLFEHEHTGAVCSVTHWHL